MSFAYVPGCLIRFSDLFCFLHISLGYPQLYREINGYIRQIFLVPLYKSKRAPLLLVVAVIVAEIRLGFH